MWSPPISTRSHARSAFDTPHSPPRRTRDTIKTNGTALKALTAGPFDDREPDWSRDGRRIAFASDRFGGISSIWQVEVDTGAVRRLSDYIGNDPCWSPSDRDVLFWGRPVPSHADLEEFVEAGLTPFQVLRAATATAAEALGAGDQLGTIEPGKLADLVIVGGDLLQDIRKARDVRGVVRGGRYYDLPTLVRR